MSSLWKVGLAVSAVATVAVLAWPRAKVASPNDAGDDSVDVPTNSATFGHYSAYSLPTRLKYKPRPYKKGEIKPVLTVHVTDVRGGFGVADYQMAPWKVALKKGLVKKALFDQLPDPDDIAGSARILALLERLHGNAYQEIGSRELGVVDNYPITLRTSHGDAGNIGPGWALDADNNEPMTPVLVEAGRLSLGRVILNLANLTGEEVIVVPHRVWDYPGRAEDPGAAVWREIVIPTLAETGARAGYNTAAGGRPIPRSWDPNALYDDKGKPIGAVS